MNWPCCRRSPGAEVSRLVRGPIDIAELTQAVSDSHLGGTTLFVGSVRRGPDDGPVIAIEYSAYDEMAEAEFDRILAEATLRWPAARVKVRHRLGRIPVGEASIAVIAASPHRADAFAACRYVIEEMKQRVPIWKKEILQDGAERWRADHTAGYGS